VERGSLIPLLPAAGATFQGRSSQMEASQAPCGSGPEAVPAGGVNALVNAQPMQA